jgi:DNA-binding MurR/RpiR family transcriptional regulator
MGFLERIAREYSHLTKSQQRLADFITGSYLDAAFLSSTELASQLDLDPGTVTRFAQRLSYDGYPELIDDVQDLVKRELRDIWEPTGDTPTAADLFRQGIDNGRRNLEEIIIRNPPETVERAVSMLENAKHIFILAPNMVAYHQGCLLRCWLLTAGFPECDVCSDLMAMSLCLRDAGEGDVFIGMGYTKYAVDVGTALRHARAKGASTIGLVGTVTCAIAEACEVNLLCPSHSPAPAPSLLAAGGAVCVLGEVLMLRREAEVEEGLHRLRDEYQALLEGRG